MLHGLMMQMPLLISSLVEHADRHHGDTEIVSRRVEGDIHRYTYRDLHRRARLAANALGGLGIRQGDRVATLAWNGYRHLELYFAVSGAGSVLHTVNPRLHPEQIAWIVNHADDRALFFDLTFALLLAGCPDNVKDPFPKSVGYQPLAYCATATPAAWPTDPVDPCPEVVNVVAVPNCGGNLNPDEYVVTDQAQARGYLKAPILTAWSRMQPTQDGDPNWIRICRIGGGDDSWAVPGSRCVDSWHWLPGVETGDFPVSFRMKYHVDEIVSVDWEHTWRQGPLEGTVATPLAVGARYQKTWGIENLRVQTTSYVLRPAPDDTCTSIELVGWLDADQSNQYSVAGTVSNAYNLLRIGVHTP